MFWKVLVPLCLLILSGLAIGDEGFGHIGKRKLTSVDTDDSVESEDVATENNLVKDTTEDQSQNDEEALTETLLDSDEEEKEKVEEEKKDKTRYDSQNLRNMEFFVRNHTFLVHFGRNQDVELVRATHWFQNFIPDKDVVILAHKEYCHHPYVYDFISTLGYALLNESNYNVIGVNFCYHMTSSDHASNLYRLRLLGRVIYALFKEHIPGFFTKSLNAYYIGEAMGLIPFYVFREISERPFQYLYALNPPKDVPNMSYRVQQEYAEVVAILTTDDYPYSYGHKNLYAVPQKGGNLRAYQILAKAITDGGRTGTYCPSAKHFKLGYCNMLPRVPIWFTHSRTSDKSYPIGRYYFYEIPFVKSRCRGRWY